MTYYYVKNIQGDIVAVYDGNGAKYGEYAYDAWGKCSVIYDKDGIATKNPYRYRGYYLDKETDLYYLNSRYYDPEVGRFLSADSLGYMDPERVNGLNLYAYCNNNPVMYIDPDGTLAGVIIGIIIGAIAVIGAITIGTIAGVTAASNGAGGWGIIGSALLGALVGAIIGAIIGFVLVVMAPAIEAGASAIGAATAGGAAVAGVSATGALVAGGAAVTVGAVVVAGTAIAVRAGMAIGNIVFAQTGRSGGYYGERWPGDHKPDHVHLKGNGINVRIGRDGKPLPGEKPLSAQARKALEKLWDEFIKLFNRW